MTKKIVRYSIKNIDKKGAQFNIIWGERSNGKSYQVKHEKAVCQFLNGSNTYMYDYKIDTVIEKVINKGSRFILMRRLKDEIKTANIEQYFQDVDVMKLTEGKYNLITIYRNRLYLSYYNYETTKTTRGDCIGYVVALSTEQNYAGASYLDVTDIIFEEFMSRSVYLPHEPDKLMNFYCTVDRKRGTTRMWLVGNSISRVCPYIYDWNLQDIILNMKQGEIRETLVSTGEIDDEGRDVKVKIACEFCMSTGQSSYTFGKNKDMLNKGSWQSSPQPHLPKSKKEYKIIYRIGFQFKTFRFLGELLLDSKTKELVWFIYPYKNEFKEKLIVISDVISQSRFWQRDIYNIRLLPKISKIINQTFNEGNIFYADDLTGTDFKQAIDFVIRR